MSKFFEFIWDTDTRSECVEVSEKDATMNQIRVSSGMKIDFKTKERIYLVPIQKT